MTIYLFDTNIVSYILRNELWVQDRLKTITLRENIFIGCPVVYFEIRRGLLVKDARSQMAHFEKLYATFLWQDYTRADWELASNLWQQRIQSGKPVADADLLIAVFAFQRNAVLITANDKDFIGLNVPLEVWKPADAD